MNDNYTISFEGQEFQINDPYHLATRTMILEALPVLKERIKDDPFEKEALEKANLLVVGADGGVLFCRVTSIKHTSKEFVFMLDDKYEPRNKNHLATWMYSRK